MPCGQVRPDRIFPRTGSHRTLPAFSGVRVYAISAGNPYITVTVVALAMVPVATNTVSVRKT